MIWKRMYTLLFNAVTDAVVEMEQQNYGQAKQLLLRGQREAEELFLGSEEEKT